MKYNATNWAWLTVIILILYVGAAWRMLEQAPTGEMVTKVHLTLTPGSESIIVGYAELGQRLDSGVIAAKNHLQVRRGRDGSWWVANVSAQRRVDAPTTNQATRYLRRWRLASGDRIRFDSVIVVVTKAAKDLVLRREGATDQASWMDNQLQQTQKPFAGCHKDSAPSWLWPYFRRNDQETRLFTLGGKIPCLYRWPLTGVPTKGAEILWRHGEYWLAPGRAEVRMARAGSTAWQSFAELEVRLDATTDPTRKLILGRTHYLPSWQQDILTLTPENGGDIWPQHLLQQRLTPRDPRVQIDWLPSDPATSIWAPLAWPPWVLATLVLGLLTSIALWSPLPTALIFLSFTWATPLTSTEPQSWLLLSLFLAWCWGSDLLLREDRLRGPVGLLWTAAMGLVLFGALLQGQLGLGSGNARWLVVAESHWWIFACAGWCLLILTQVRPANWQVFAVLLVDPDVHRVWQWVRAVLPWVAGIFVLLLQFAFGSEEGIGKIQPVEGIKTFSALLLAYGGQRLQARRAGLDASYLAMPEFFVTWLMGPVGLFIIFSVGLLWAVRDHSPVFILFLLVIPMLWVLMPHPLGLWKWANFWRTILGLLVIVFIGFFVWVGVAPETVPRVMFPQSDRLMVWAQPELFDASGYQFNMAQKLAAAGGFIGKDADPFGWNGRIMSLPMVQNDFIGAFVLNRLGSLGGILLLCLQLLYAGALFALSTTAAAWSKTQNFPGQRAGIFLSLSLFALAWLFLAHGLIAWGNVLRLLPVMGQPMTFIAAGNSHILLFALPGLILGLGTGWLIGTGNNQAAT